LFPSVFDHADIEIKKIQCSKHVKNVVLSENKYLVLMTNDAEVILRRPPSSDISVFNQIFNIEEYKPLVGLAKNLFKDSEFVMIDGGSNIGLASCYISMYLKVDKLFLIEPLDTNFEAMVNNINKFGLASVSHFYRNALCGKPSERYSLSRDFRDGKDWSAFVVPDSNGDILGLTLMEIIKNNGLNRISYLKLDIEGAERYLFSSNDGTDFLLYVDLISIEIHDEFGVRTHICDTLSKHGFIVFDAGELTIGINLKSICN
jgi:FkbM family methyltransferase